VTRRTYFLNCCNSSCNLRFPLDLEQYKGEFCPRCGANLRADQAAKSQASLPTQKPYCQAYALLDNLRSAYNVGAIFRTADGAGFQGLHLCGITPTPAEHPGVSKTALGAEKTLPWVYHTNAPLAAAKLKDAGYTLLVLETLANSQSLYNYLPPMNAQILLILGNEEAGVDPALMQAADLVLHLPMQGSKKSLNVAEAFSIAAYQLSFGVFN
jgi:23S rRNA (guanosine2251-2'-O)-methyltransferase